jgi:hypothetical protein
VLAVVLPVVAVPVVALMMRMAALAALIVSVAGFVFVTVAPAVILVAVVPAHFGAAAGPGPPASAGNRGVAGCMYSSSSELLPCSQSSAFSGATTGLV